MSNVSPSSSPRVHAIVPNRVRFENVARAVRFSESVIYTNHTMLALRRYEAHT